MLLITVHQKCGPRDETKLLTRDATKWLLNGPTLFMTRQPLAAALKHLHAYIMAYRERYTASTLLMQVTHIVPMEFEPTDPEAMHELGIEHLDSLPTSAAAFEL